MPGWMKFDLVDAMAEAIEGAQVRGLRLAAKAKRDGLQLAQRRAQCAEIALPPRPRLRFTASRSGVAAERL